MTSIRRVHAVPGGITIDDSGDDDAYALDRQRDIDDQTALAQPHAAETRCPNVNCLLEKPEATTVCSNCGTNKMLHAPVKRCQYFKGQLCYCNGRATCVESA